MSRLTTKRRDKLPKKDFALPSRIHRGKRGAEITRGAYPIEDKAHARSALARAKHEESPRTYKAIARKVHRKYPTMVIKALGMKHRKK